MGVVVRDAGCMRISRCDVERTLASWAHSALQGRGSPPTRPRSCWMGRSMRILLFGLGILALLSGGLKFRDRIRTRIGTTPLSLGELALGAIACVLALSMPQPTPLHSGVAAAIVVALVAAGVHQSKLTTAFQHRRDLSEAHRLQRFVDVVAPAQSEAATAKTKDARRVTGPGA